MGLRVGMISAAHVHAPSYAYCFGILDSEFVGVWDDDPARSAAFSEAHQAPAFASLEQLLESCDAVVITSENVKHEEFALAAMRAGKHVLCEKPLAISTESGERMIAEAQGRGVVLMTAFPCPYSPAFEKLLAQIERGEIGKVRAICATNRGTCPFGWFVDRNLSGGGAMIDHTVHVADLLRRILKCDPIRVTAQTGSRIYGKEWEDTAMLTLDYPNGVFATLDSSWSRPASYKTWGDVTMNVVGDSGVLELDMFGTEIDQYSPGAKSHTVRGFGTNLDLLMCQEFLSAILERRTPRTSAEDGLAAAKVALDGYASLSQQ